VTGAFIITRRSLWLWIAVAASFAIMCGAMSGCERRGSGSASNPAAGTSKQRIVVLSPALAVTMKDLGLEGMVVGRHAYDLALDPALPVCGDQAGIDYEAMLGAKPTDVVIEWGSRDLPPRLTELARIHSWTLTSFSTLLTLDEIRASAERLGSRFVPPERRADVEALVARMDRAWSKRGDFRGAGRVLIVMGTSPVVAVLGPGSFHQQILERIGGEPAIAEGSPYMELDAEDVLRCEPGMIVLVSPAPAGTARGARPLEAGESASRLGALAALDIPALKEGHLWLIDDPLALLPGSNMAGFADDLERGLRRFSAGR